MEGYNYKVNEDILVIEVDEIILLRGRVRFVGGESSAPFPSAVVVFRPRPSINGLHLTRLSALDARCAKLLK